MKRILIISIVVFVIIAVIFLSYFIKDEGVLKCENITNDFNRKLCFNLLAMNRNDYRYCNFIEDASEKMTCYSLTFKYPEKMKAVCDSMFNITEKDFCIFAIVDNLKIEGNMTKEQTEMYCRQIENGHMKGACLGRFTELLEYDKGVVVCSSVEDSFGRDYCFYALASYQDINKREEVCNMIAHDDLKSTCIHILGLKNYSKE